MKILIRDVLLDGATTDIFMDNGLILEITPQCSRKADKVINGRNKAALPLVYQRPYSRRHDPFQGLRRRHAFEEMA